MSSDVMFPLLVTSDGHLDSPYLDLVAILILAILILVILIFVILILVLNLDLILINNEQLVCVHSFVLPRLPRPLFQLKPQLQQRLISH